MNAIEREKRVVAFMIRLYCTRNHKRSSLCEECSELIKYAMKKLDACRYGIDKPACKRCKTHCYGKSMRADIRKIMRYSGPRMIWFMPLEILRHKDILR